MFRKLFAFALLALLSAVSYPSLAAELVFATSHDQLTTTIAANVQNQLQLPLEFPGKLGKIVIAVGVQALEEAAAAAEPSTTVVSIYTYSFDYQSIKTKYPAKRITAIYLDPDPYLQVALAKRLVRQNGTVGILTGSLTESALLSNVSKEYSDVIFQKSGVSNELFKKLGILFEQADSVVLIPDKSLLTKDVASAVVDMGVDNKKMLIGFTTGYVKLGSLATVYSDTDDFAKQLSEILHDFSDQNKLPAASFPKYVRVALNKQLAEWYGIKDVNEESLAIFLRSLRDKK